MALPLCYCVNKYYLDGNECKICDYTCKTCTNRGIKYFKINIL